MNCLPEHVASKWFNRVYSASQQQHILRISLNKVISKRIYALIQKHAVNTNNGAGELGKGYQVFIFSVRLYIGP